MGWRGGLVALVAVLAAGTAAALAHRTLQPVDPNAPSQLFTVERGIALAQVTRRLERAGLVRSARATEWLARLQGLAGRLQAGEYQLSPGLSSREILDRISSGRVVTYELALPEGMRAAEIAGRLEERGLAEAEAFMAVVKDPELARELGVEGLQLEGYLYPETYRLPRTLPPEEIARTMVEQFKQVWREIEPLAARRGMSMLEVVTLASIVEKETGEASERPLIAAVFLNRLDRGMRLETDPAVIYGIEDFDGNLTKRHLRDASNPYNTYRHPGLPPGPIASPGADALRAVVRPSQSDYLYFVSMNDGTHKFSRTYREHVNAVNRYQKTRRHRAK
jgi:UPF0755 protein